MTKSQISMVKPELTEWLNELVNICTRLEKAGIKPLDFMMQISKNDKKWHYKNPSDWLNEVESTLSDNTGACHEN